jgi:hypothetical protein
MDTCSGPSAVLLAANQRLRQLRETLQAERAAGEEANGRSSLIPAAPQTNWPGLLAALPPHLGWESAALTAVLRPLSPPTPAHDPFSPAGGVGKTAVSQPIAPRPADIKLYPDIALGMLRTGGTAVGRLWLLCHHLDPFRSGKLRIDILTQKLTSKTSPTRLCGKRHLRNLLREGEGVYWTRDKYHLWLRSTARVALALGVTRLTGWPVALPTAVLLGPIGDFRAHLYAAFHSGRTKAPDSAGLTTPIARATLTGLSGVGRSSQRNYEMRLGLRAQANFAVGEAVTEVGQEEQGWRRGAALFTLADHKGKQGKQGKLYLAWQLPNSYAGKHQRRPKGRQKRINRQLKDLVMQGMPGNAAAVIETRTPERVYFPDGKRAAQSAAARPEGDHYWRAGAGRVWRRMGGGAIVN